MATILKSLLILFSIFALSKFVFFFAFDYRRRRLALDRAYQGRLSATSTSDWILRLITVVLVLLLWVRGGDAGSFLTGLLVGMTLIQLYFHQFSVPLDHKHAPPSPASPIKVMSYAIQAQPKRPWLEISLIIIMLGASLYELVMSP